MHAHKTHFRLSFVYTIQSHRCYYICTFQQFTNLNWKNIHANSGHKSQCDQWFTYPTKFTIFINLAVRRFIVIFLCASFWLDFELFLLLIVDDDPWSRATKWLNVPRHHQPTNPNQTQPNFEHKKQEYRFVYENSIFC